MDASLLKDPNALLRADAQDEAKAVQSKEEAILKKTCEKYNLDVNNTDQVLKRLKEDKDELEKFNIEFILDKKTEWDQILNEVKGMKEQLFRMHTWMKGYSTRLESLQKDISQVEIENNEMEIEARNHDLLSTELTNLRKKLDLPADVIAQCQEPAFEDPSAFKKIINGINFIESTLDWAQTSEVKGMRAVKERVRFFTELRENLVRRFVTFFKLSTDKLMLQYKSLRIKFPFTNEMHTNLTNYSLALYQYYLNEQDAADHLKKKAAMQAPIEDTSSDGTKKHFFQMNEKTHPHYPLFQYLENYNGLVAPTKFSPENIERLKNQYVRVKSHIYEKHLRHFFEEAKILMKARTGTPFSLGSSGKVADLNQLTGQPAPLTSQNSSKDLKSAANDNTSSVKEDQASEMDAEDDVPEPDPQESDARKTEHPADIDEDETSLMTDTDRLAPNSLPPLTPEESFKLLIFSMCEMISYEQKFCLKYFFTDKLPKSGGMSVDKMMEEIFTYAARKLLKFCAFIEKKTDHLAVLQNLNFCEKLFLIYQEECPFARKMLVELMHRMKILMKKFIEFQAKGVRDTKFEIKKVNLAPFVGKSFYFLARMNMNSAKSIFRLTFEFKGISDKEASNSKSVLDLLLEMEKQKENAESGQPKKEAGEEERAEEPGVNTEDDLDEASDDELNNSELGGTPQQQQPQSNSLYCYDNVLKAVIQQIEALSESDQKHKQEFRLKNFHFLHKSLLDFVNFVKSQNLDVEQESIVSIMNFANSAKKNYVAARAKYVEWVMKDNFFADFFDFYEKLDNYMQSPSSEAFVPENISKEKFRQLMTKYGRPGIFEKTLASVVTRIKRHVGAPLRGEHKSYSVFEHVIKFLCQEMKKRYEKFEIMAQKKYGMSMAPPVAEVSVILTNLSEGKLKKAKK